MGQANLNNRQSVAWRLLEDSKTTEILYGGGAGSGKSWLGALWLFTNCLRYPGSRWLMGRAVLKTLKETTLNSFFDVAGSHGFKAGQHYNYNGQTGTIHIGESSIILKDLFAYPSDPNFDDLGSLEITGAFIDEANQVTAKAKAIVGSRTRYKLDEFGLVPKLLMTCNPAKNWVYGDFYDPWRNGTLRPNRAFVQALVTDNPHFAPTTLPDGTLKPHSYIAKLEELDGPDRARLLLGDWDYDSDPAQLMDADSIRNIFTNEHVPPGQKALTCDVARYGSDKTVVMLWEGLRVVKVYVFTGQATNITAAGILATAKMEGVPRSRIVVDDDGVGGGVVDLLQGCLPFKGGAKPVHDENYLNLKAQCCYVLAQHVCAGEVHVEDDSCRDELSQELAWIKRWKMDHDGKLAVMPKDKVKEGLGRSPDYADNLMMRMVLELKGAPLAVDLLAKKGGELRKARRREEIKRYYKYR